ncbi:MAG: sugar phosphate isomerase/epimerase family protein [Planctomycetota bacterium]
MSAGDTGIMRLGIGSYTYPWAVGIPGHVPADPLTAIGLLEKARELGVHVVQICDNLPLDAMSATELDELRHAAAECKITVELGTRGIAAEHLRRQIELCRMFRSPILRVVVDTATHHPSPDEVVELLRPMVPELESAGVCLAIENHDRFTARAFSEIVSRLDSRCVGICLDTANSFGALEGPETIVTSLAPWVVNLHLKEFAIHRMPHMLGFVIEGRPAGQGRLDIPWLLAKLRDQRCAASAILEQWTPPEPTLAATIAKEDAWARESVRYLRSLVPN